MAWKDLSFREKAEYIKHGVKNGLRTPEEIQNAYNAFAGGGDLDNWKKRLSDYWGGQDLSKDDYDYDAYYNNNPREAERQLNKILNGDSPHFTDEFKKKSHPTYPDLGINSWNKDETVFYPSERQIRDSDRILDYLGADHKYNNGATKVSYKDGQVLPNITVTPNESYIDLRRNKLNTGWVYSDRPNSFGDGGDSQNQGVINYVTDNWSTSGRNLYNSGKMIKESDDTYFAGTLPNVDVYGFNDEDAAKALIMQDLWATRGEGEGNTYLSVSKDLKGLDAVNVLKGKERASSYYTKEQINEARRYLNGETKYDDYSSIIGKLTFGGLPQAAFLLKPEKQDAAFRNHGYSQINNYGLVNKVATGYYNKTGKRPRAYQRFSNEENRDNLNVIGNVSNTVTNPGSLEHAGRTTSSIYNAKNSPDLIYANEWDFNDYEGTSGFGDSFLNKYGYPMVVSSGIRSISKRERNFIINEMTKQALSKSRDDKKDKKDYRTGKRNIEY